MRFPSFKSDEFHKRKAKHKKGGWIYELSKMRIRLKDSHGKFTLRFQEFSFLGGIFKKASVGLLLLL
jgi:hypothetical protein